MQHCLADWVLNWELEQESQLLTLAFPMEGSFWHVSSSGLQDQQFPIYFIWASQVLCVLLAICNLTSPPYLLPSLNISTTTSSSNHGRSRSKPACPYHCLSLSSPQPELKPNVLALHWLSLQFACNERQENGPQKRGTKEHGAKIPLWGLCSRQTGNRVSEDLQSLFMLVHLSGCEPLLQTAAHHKLSTSVQYFVQNLVPKETLRV